MPSRSRTRATGHEVDLSSVVVGRGSDPASPLAVAARLGGEPRANKPSRACTVVATFVESWSNALGHEDRQQLKRHLAPLASSMAGPETQAYRGMLAVDWLARVLTPAWLRHVDLRGQANQLAALPPVDFRGRDLHQVCNLRAAAASAAAAAETATTLAIGTSARLVTGQRLPRWQAASNIDATAARAACDAWRASVPDQVRGAVTWGSLTIDALRRITADCRGAAGDAARLSAFRHGPDTWMRQRSLVTAMQDSAHALIARMLDA